MTDARTRAIEAITGVATSGGYVLSEGECDELIERIELSGLAIIDPATPAVAAELQRILDSHEPWELLEALHTRVAELDKETSQ